MLDYILYAVALLLVLGGLAGSILPLLPGIPMIFGGLWLAAWLNGFQHVGLWTLSLIALLGLAALVLDFVAGALGAQRVGASKAAIWGALIGTIIGLFFGLLGLLLGPFIGALLGELSSGNSVLRSTHISFATWIGMLLGALAKLVLSLMMIGIFLLAQIW
ncbi:MAG TPA: DUF456 domain-containing protein [Salinisphaeraceae bacterium]|nr:DUF456 domain-containing protein [Salinisphaeraceae bacterium]